MAGASGGVEQYARAQYMLQNLGLQVKLLPGTLPEKCFINKLHGWPGKVVHYLAAFWRQTATLQSRSVPGDYAALHCTISTSGKHVNAAVLLQRYERNIKKGMLTDETIMLWNERWELRQ